ncbi:ABC transporter ATP-binding protein [Pseudodesulfovibrio senegalensis]|uniref:ATP-binding cassette domain-containing protein n=1 Tax=Pseudodesulfovibrio senegalensis TaxID=1721087 RepID=A0A6N6N0W8_9BACT|nr:ATP-binding cassette domain-containing protein [Pseudodesulfovibrio senegalensis]KAB1439077.1 ATP-binding cassette domain-containing protein [Pseudodesulfovibrio senegalensis]
MPVVELSGIRKTYGRGGFFHKQERFTVLEDVNLSLNPGESLGLVGRSGSGKSTLGRIMLGLEAPDAGSVRILGQDVTGRKRLPMDVRRAVQVVFQDAIGSSNPRLTAGEIIAEPLRNFDKLKGRQLRDRVAELLELVGLCPDDADKLPGRFSGGQLQRVCIARALAPSPQVIVLDEAVSSLDMLIQARILDLLDSLRRQYGTAYLFVTHDLRLVRRFCDRAFFMSDGSLHAFDPSRTLDMKGSGVLRELFDAILPPMPDKARQQGSFSERVAV